MRLAALHAIALGTILAAAPSGNAAPAPPSPGVAPPPSAHATAGGLPKSHPAPPASEPGPMRPAAPAGSLTPAPGKTAPVTEVTLRIRHQVFADFIEDHRVTLGEEFPVGDTEYSGQIIDYVPDFAMEMKSLKVISRSTEPNNPAFRIIVRQKGVPQDTTWALLNMPPHFARKSILAFRVLKIEFKGHKPVVPAESKATQVGRAGKP